MKRFTLILITLFVALAAPVEGKALSLALDSVAQWGRFPRFCVDTYRWGDRFFNGYDTTYVQGTGCKFNAKITANSWTDIYNFTLPDHSRIYMSSNTSATTGVYLTYLAVSAGYDISMNKIFGSAKPARKRWRFGFNCMLFAAEIYYIKNNEGATIKRFGSYTDVHIPFNGITNDSWGLDAYYFFNHKRYSEAATFNYSRLQRRSQGAFYTGVSIYTQKLNFDFSLLPTPYQATLPPTWTDRRYSLHTHNWALRLGYGYNWVLPHGWVIGVSESPVIGLRKGFVNSNVEKYSFSLYNRLKLAAVWNHGRWFFGANAHLDMAFVNDKETTYAGGNLTGEAVFGYRFNLW